MAMSAAEELASQFGRPNGDGAYLVGMIDLHAAMSEDDAFARTVLGLRSMVKKLGFPRVADSNFRHDELAAFADVMPGVTIAVIRNACASQNGRMLSPRIPSQDEHHAWLRARPAVERNSHVDALWWHLGFVASEADEWRGVVTRCMVHNDEVLSESQVRDLAVAWRVAGFEVSAVPSWCQALGGDADGVDLIHAAREWRDRGFDAEDATRWASGCPGPSASAEQSDFFRAAGWHPFELWLLDEFIDPKRNPDLELARRRFARLGPALALDMARAGMGPGDAPSLIDHLLDQDGPAQDWDSKLRAAYANRTPIDPYVAMHINHHMWLAYGEEVPNDVPFRAERIWDLHNEADEKDALAGRPPSYGVPNAMRPGHEPARAETPCPGSGGPVVLLEKDTVGYWVKCRHCRTEFGEHLVDERLPRHLA